MADTLVLTAVLIPDEDGGYAAQIAELPGAISQGETVEAALTNVREAAELYLEYASEEERTALKAHPVTATVEVNIT